MFPFLKTIQSIFKANLTGILAACAGLAVVFVILLVTLSTWAADDLINLQTGWLDSLINWMIGIVTGIGGWFMLPSISVIIAGMFQETVIHKVEETYYPEQAGTEPPSFWPDLGHDIAFTLRAIFLNILVLPFYFIGIGFFISIALNSYLLGREFFESAAAPHGGKKKAFKLGQANKIAVYGGGFVITLATLAPVLNFFTPVLAVVWMVHVFHTIRAKTPKPI